MIANKSKIKEIEQAKKTCKESVSIGTTHALEIFGKSTHVHPICPLLERVGTSQSVQTSQGFLCPQHSESIDKGVLPPRQHKEVGQPLREPPDSWSNVTTTGGGCEPNRAEQHPAASKSLPAQEGETVEEQRSSRKCCMASQSSKTRASTRNTQSTAFKHVKRKPKRSRVLWRDKIWVDVITNSIERDLQSIDGVERRLRTRNVERHKVTPKTQESDPNPNSYQGVNPLAQAGQIRPDDERNSSKTCQRTNHDTDNKLSRSSSSNH